MLCSCPVRPLIHSLLIVLAGAIPYSGVVSAHSPRDAIDLSGVWKFYPAFVEIQTRHDFLGSRPAGAPHGGWVLPGFDDSRWWDIQVPGSWNTQFEDLGSYEGEGWYRKELFVPGAWEGMEVLFQSDGANYRTLLYVNGVFAGEHDGGFTQFSLPIHAFLQYDSANTIAVAVENETRLERVPMERHDWWQHGGLYRPVRLIARPSIHVAGLRVRTVSVEEPAVVAVAASVAGAGVEGLRLSLRLLDADGHEAASVSLEAPGDASVQEISSRIQIPGARLWSPETPSLYTLEATLTRADDGHLLDLVRESVGVRTIGVEAEQFLLNGRPYRIKGLNRYENYPDSGMTNTPDGLHHDIALMKALGANSARCHYPYSRETYDAFDRAGLLAVCEIPLYQWGRPGHSEANTQAARAQLEEMIATLGNHPSIGFWSVSNETRTRPREPGPEHEKLSEMVVRGNLELIDVAHRLDPDRPVIAPSNRWPNDPAFQGTDLNSVNVYIGVEQPHVDSLPALRDAVAERFDALRREYPKRPILVTEFGSWALRGLMTDYFPGELYQAELLKTLWEAFEQEPGFVGGFIWVFADSDVHRKFTTIYEMRCAYGLYDLHRRPKAAAETVRRMWTASPGEDGNR